ncbi:uncharacterized protein OCT59_009508 [Rhizophagus irregularis]|uniref:uncharacterized protein n=1 Tax=Rhizophagus irregularis TaxID=588596 RepID=UPI00332CEB0F|nr:hypothetical protein OCT59_009508 [Rhizophagus irregularis]
MVMDFTSATTATHKTSSLYGYGLRFCHWLQLPIELHFCMVMDFAFAVVSLLILKRWDALISDNFWLKSLPRSKHHNMADNKEINAENVFLSCDLTCIEEMREEKKQKPIKTTTIEVDKG